MAKLIEVLPVREAPGEGLRRWFTSSEMDLIIWCDDLGTPVSFQLCYDKPGAERALTWKPDLGFLHTAVDDGEIVDGKHKATPILVADGHFDANRITERFAQASVDLPNAITVFVRERLRRYPGYIHAS